MRNESVTPADFRFVHFTDTHIMAEGVYVPRSGEWQCDTTASLRRVIEAIKSLEPPPAFAVVGGDLASPDLSDRSRVPTAAEYEPSYRLLLDILQPLPCPTYLLIGNHDNRIAFHRVMGTDVAIPEAPHDYSFDHQGYHFVALDSQQPGQIWGQLEADQLAWLRTDLEAHRGQPTLVFVHHHPRPLGLAWLDALQLRNGDELLRLLREYTEVRGVICGHVHLDQEIQRDGLSIWTTPSTCFQFSKLSQTYQPFPEPPGFRIVDVKGNELSMRVLHLPGEAGGHF